MAGNQPSVRRLHDRRPQLLAEAVGGYPQYLVDPLLDLRGGSKYIGHLMFLSAGVSG